MTDERREIEVRVRVSYALWPGDGNFCVSVAGSAFFSEQLFLVNRDGRRHELRSYRCGMFGRRR